MPTAPPQQPHTVAGIAAQTATVQSTQKPHTKNQLEQAIKSLPTTAHHAPIRAFKKTMETATETYRSDCKAAAIFEDATHIPKDCKVQTQFRTREQFKSDPLIAQVVAEQERNNAAYIKRSTATFRKGRKLCALLSLKNRCRQFITELQNLCENHVTYHSNIHPYAGYQEKTTDELAIILMPRLITSFSTELLTYLGSHPSAVSPTHDDFRFGLIDYIDFKGTNPSTAPDLGYSQLHTHGQEIIDISSEEIKRYLEYATCIPDETKARRQQQQLAAARVQARCAKKDTLAATQATAAAIAAEPKADMPTLQLVVDKSVNKRLTSSQKKKRPRGTGNKRPAATADAKAPPRKKAKNSPPVPKHPKATGDNNKGTKKAATKQNKVAASKAKQGKKPKEPNVPTPTDSGPLSVIKKTTRFTTDQATPTNQKKPPPNNPPGRQPGRGRGRGHPGSGTSRGRGKQRR